MLRALLFIAALAFAAAAAAQQYKWVDKDGRVQYGDAPPSGARAAPMRRSPAASYQQEPAENKDGAKDNSAKDNAGKDGAKKGPLTINEQEAEFRKRRQASEQERQKQAKADQERADKRENCARAQENVRTIESGRVSRADASGERYYLDDAQLAQEGIKARQSVREWCN